MQICGACGEKAAAATDAAGGRASAAGVAMDGGGNARVAGVVAGATGRSRAVAGVSAAKGARRLSGARRTTPVRVQRWFVLAPERRRWAIVYSVFVFEQKIVENMKTVWMFSINLGGFIVVAVFKEARFCIVFARCILFPRCVVFSWRVFRNR